MRNTRELEGKLEAESQRYEERITELHCVIAELRRKLEQQRGNAIAEDDEEELAEDDEVSQDLNYQSGTRESNNKIFNRRHWGKKFLIDFYKKID
jgi:hypothetical protein